MLSVLRDVLIPLRLTELSTGSMLKSTFPATLSITMSLMPAWNETSISLPSHWSTSRSAFERSTDPLIEIFSLMPFPDLRSTSLRSIATTFIGSTLIIPSLSALPVSLRIPASFLLPSSSTIIFGRSTLKSNVSDASPSEGSDDASRARLMNTSLSLTSSTDLIISGI